MSEEREEGKEDEKRRESEVSGCGSSEEGEREEENDATNIPGISSCLRETRKLEVRKKHPSALHT